MEGQSSCMGKACSKSGKNCSRKKFVNFRRNVCYLCEHSITNLFPPSPLLPPPPPSLPPPPPPPHTHTHTHSSTTSSRQWIMGGRESSCTSNKMSGNTRYRQRVQENTEVEWKPKLSTRLIVYFGCGLCACVCVCGGGGDC